MQEQERLLRPHHSPADLHGSRGRHARQLQARMRGRLSYLLRRRGGAHELLTYYRESDIVAVTGISEPRPSTASAMTPWAGRFRVRTLRIPEVIWAAA